ncbi:hypothetical protein SAVIM338S_06289 [Streptomyces avidinii]
MELREDADRLVARSARERGEDPEAAVAEAAEAEVAAEAAAEAQAVQRRDDRGNFERRDDRGKRSGRGGFNRDDRGGDRPYGRRDDYRPSSSGSSFGGDSARRDDKPRWKRNG